MDLQASYCACCDKMMRTDINVFKNLINLKDFLVKRKLWPDNIRNRMTVFMYRKLIETKLHKLRVHSF